MSVEGMLRHIGRIRREEARRILQNRVRRAQLRENLRRTIHTAISAIRYRGPRCVDAEFVGGEA